MPIYAYKCSSCGHADDVLQKVSADALTVCPACGQSTYSKQVTAPQFQLKGSGWYVTDFRGGTNAKSDAKPDAESDGAKSEGASDSKAESKSDSKSETKSDSKSERKSDSASSTTTTAPTTAPAKPTAVPVAAGSKE